MLSYNAGNKLESKMMQVLYFEYDVKHCQKNSNEITLGLFFLF